MKQGETVKSGKTDKQEKVGKQQNINRQKEKGKIKENAYTVEEAFTRFWVLRESYVKKTGDVYKRQPHGKWGNVRRCGIFHGKKLF